MSAQKAILRIISAKNHFSTYFLPDHRENSFKMFQFPQRQSVLFIFSPPSPERPFDFGRMLSATVFMYSVFAPVSSFCGWASSPPPRVPPHSPPSDGLAFLAANFPLRPTRFAPTFVVFLKQQNIFSFHFSYFYPKMSASWANFSSRVPPKMLRWRSCCSKGLLLRDFALKVIF